MNPKNDAALLDFLTSCDHAGATLALDMPSLGIRHALCPDCRTGLEHTMSGAPVHAERWENRRIQDERSVDGRYIYDDMLKAKRPQDHKEKDA